MNQFNFHPFPNFKTERLELRALRDEDEKEIFFFRSDPAILEFLDMPPAKTIEEARAFIKKIENIVQDGESIYWGIQLKNKLELIGTICLWNISSENCSAEVGYVLHPAFQGMGYMQEALKYVLDYGFKIMSLKSINADLSPNNLKSVRILEKNNFIKINSSQNNETVLFTLNNPFFSNT